MSKNYCNSRVKQNKRPSIDRHLFFVHGKPHDLAYAKQSRISVNQSTTDDRLELYQALTPLRGGSPSLRHSGLCSLGLNFLGYGLPP